MEALAREELPNIRLNTPVRTLFYDEAAGEWLVNGEFRARNVITTIPWPSLYEALGRPEEIRAPMRLIRYNKVVISLFETDRNDNNYHWRYRPEMDQQHHRELFISNFVRDSKQFGVFTETNADRFDALKLTFPGRNLCN